MRKDVTPQKNDQPNESQENRETFVKNKRSNDSYMKRFGISLLAGCLGGALMIGGYTLVEKDSSASKTTTTSTVKDTGTTKVQSTKVSADTDVTEAVETMQNAVVSVTTLQKQSSQSYGSSLEDLFGASDSNSDDSGELTEASEGSGVIYRKDGDKAYIVTNNHVVSGADAVTITFSTGETEDAKIVGTDTYSDLAVLEIPSEHVTNVAEFANSDDVKVGETALAMGSPLGSDFSNSVSQGIVSAKDRMISSTTEDGQTINSNAIQTDAAINPGNSGGALVNSSGQVIGINSSKIAQATTGVSAEGMGFAIPSNDVVSIINQLETGKAVTRPMLGVTMIDLSQVSSQDKESVLKLKDDSVNGGVVITSVTEDSPAENASLKKYDVITQLDGTDVSSPAELQSILYKKAIGDTLEVTYYRDGSKKTAKVTLDQDSSKLQEQQKEAQENSQQQGSNQGSSNR